MFDSSFFFNVFVVYPAVRRILSYKKDSVSIRSRLALAILFLSTIGVVELIVDMYDDWGSNYFEVLGVSHDATLAEVKKAYKSKALEFHPDKNPGAEEIFVRIKDAYNVLLNPESRDVYDKWGPSGLEWLEKEHGAGVLMTGSIQNMVFYITWATLVFLMTMSSAETNSRAWSYAGLGMVCAIDFGMRFGDLDIPVPFLPSLAMYQKVNILQKLFPSFMHGCIVIQSAVFVDTDRLNLQYMKTLVKQNYTLLLRLQALEAEMRSAKLIKGTGSAATVSGQQGAAKEVTEEANLPRNKFAAAKQRASQAVEANAQAQDQPTEKFKMPGFVYMVGIYVLFNYVLK